MIQINSLEELHSIWPSLPPQEQEHFLHLLRGVDSPLYWMKRCTTTVDDQDKTGNPFKPFPDYPYFDVVYQQFLKEPFLVVEKSRTMMMTWFFSAVLLHCAMTQPGTTTVIISKDIERALVPMYYQHRLYENQSEEFKRLWPLDRPLAQQSVYGLDFINKSRSISIPGKDPGKIRSLHPTYVFIDEACEMESFSETWDVALAARPIKLIAISSANLGDFRDLTEPAVPEEF